MNRDIQDLWQRLATLRELTFESRSQSTTPTGWSGVGQGTVRVEVPDATTLLFHEKGAWTPATGGSLNFTNLFRWTADWGAQSLQLEHLRFGPNKPVYLFHLVPVAPQRLESSEPHVCREDLYTAQLEYDASGVRLDWRITGPTMNEQIAYTYW